MNREKLLELVKSQMTEHRFVHTLGVAETAVKLAKKYQANEEDADLAGILHDYCKYWDKARMQSIIENDPTISKDLLQFDKELWHAPVGAVVVEQELAIQKPEVLSAIRYHTSGRINMTKLEKIVWLADYIEPNRQFPGVEDVRMLAETDLEAALIKAFGNTIAFLAKQERKIYPLTVEAYNDLIHKTKNGKETDT